LICGLSRRAVVFFEPFARFTLRLAGFLLAFFLAILEPERTVAERLLDFFL
jgi:hypothetical protein